MFRPSGFYLRGFGRDPREGSVRRRQRPPSIPALKYTNVLIDVRLRADKWRGAAQAKS